MRSDIKFDITDPCSSLNTDNEAITILLRKYQDSISISTIYIPPASTISTALLDNIKKTADNIIITGDLNAKHVDFNCTKSDKWGLALKKALYNIDLLIADNRKPTHKDGRTNKSDIIDYIISSPAIFNKVQNPTLNNDHSSDHYAILFDLLTNLKLKSVFANKIELKDKNLERTIVNCLILNIQDYCPLKFVDDHEEFININELDRIMKNLDIKKAPGLDSINNKLIKHLKPALLKFLHFFFILCINFGIHPANWKIEKVIMIHKTGKPEDLIGSYRSLSLTSCLGKLFEKVVADNVNNWTEANKKFNKQQNGFRKNRSTATGIFIDVKKSFDQVWY